MWGFYWLCNRKWHYLWCINWGYAPYVTCSLQWCTSCLQTTPRASSARFYSSEIKKCTIIPGDGIGPEISAAVQKIFSVAQVPIEWESVDVTPVRVSKITNILFESASQLSLLGSRWKIWYSTSCYWICESK